MKNKKNFGNFLYLISIAFLIASIFTMDRGFDENPYRLPGFLFLGIAALYNIWWTKKEKKENGK